MNKFNKGFTLIELLVVIAIIGILSSVVLASLNTARAKGADAAVKSNLANARAQAELFYDANNNSYFVSAGALDVCSSTSNAPGGVKGVFANVDAARVAAGAATMNTVLGTAGTLVTHATCHAAANGSAWAAEAPLKAGGMYCVDSTGASKSTVAAMLASATACL